MVWKNYRPQAEGHFWVKRTRRRPLVKVTTDGRNVVSHVGARLLADTAEKLGLEAALSVAMAPTKQRRRGHDRGGVPSIWP